MKPLYTIERWPHGWVFCGPEGRGIPMDALNECAKLFPKAAVLHSGIAHNLRQTHSVNAIMCVGVAKDLSKWEAEITVSLAAYPPEARWWRGFDTGASSASMFAILATDSVLRFQAREHHHGETPRDAGDFGRCRRLLELLPEWRGRLSEVAAAYPATKWPALVERWSELDKLQGAELTAAIGRL